MDIIFVNGKIHTLDDTNLTCSAVGVSNGMITGLGTEAEVRRLTGAKTEVVDLKGAVMFPGFMEAHNHLPMYGYLTDGIDLSPKHVRKMDDILDRVQTEAQKVSPGTWIKGSRYAEYFLAENRHPTKSDLDPVSPRHPVILFHTSLHSCVLNSRALQNMGVTRETPHPQGGIIEKDPDSGEPTGVLQDQAMMDVFNKLFFDSLAAMGTHERIALCERTVEKFSRVGLVFAGDAMVVPPTLHMYQETLAAGRLKIRIYTMNYALMAEPLTGSQIKTGFGCGKLRIGPIKLFADGGMSNRTAAVGTSYLTPPYDKGLKIQSREELIHKVKQYHDLGYQIAIHAQGDEGIQDTLDAYEAVLGPQSDNPLRHRIEHAGCLYPHLLRRATAMNILASVQPVFFGELGDGFLDAFGPELAHQLYPFKSMLRAGMRLGGSSDCPVANLDPRVGLRDAVLRRTPSGETLGPAEALSMDEAIRLYTRGSAYLSFDETRNGTIAVGKRGDFTVMAADPREVAPEEVPEIPVVMTVVDGEIVWSA
ncbi:MAG: amidohydrolase [Deltaproteobacteria bacterium]|nr:amidohydrolase [Deltaproteobacteria bacterium]